MSHHINELENTSSISSGEWNLTPLFSGDHDPRIEEDQKEAERLSYIFINKWKDRSDYLEDAGVLKEALDEYEVWARTTESSGKSGYYFWLRTQQDESNPELKARLNKINDRSNAISNDIQFFLLRLAKVAPDIQARLLGDARLAAYHHFLERLFKGAQYWLSEAEEKIITLKYSVAHEKWETMLSAFLSKEERDVEDEDGTVRSKTFEELMTLLSSISKKVRDGAAHAVNDILARHIEVGEAEMNAILQNKKVDDELRHVSRPDLLRHISDDIESELVDVALSAIEKRFDIARRFYALKAKLLGVSRLEYHERNVPYGTFDARYSFEDAVRMTRQVFARLDPSFATIFDSFLEHGQIDIYPRKGKRGGAFCVGVHKDYPVYVMLNFTEKLRDVTTLAHEMGHAINDVLVGRAQHELYYGAILSTAEVASTFMEDFIVEELEKDADDEARLSLMMERLNDDVSTIFRQAACYRFEEELHATFRAKGYLSHQEIGAIFQKHMTSYMGEAVEQSAGAENWWLYWSHIRNFFYVYSYATGLLISKSLQAGVRKDASYIEKVKEFLSAGKSASARDIFRRAGIDIAEGAFWERGLEEIEHALEKVEELAKKLQKI